MEVTLDVVVDMLLLEGCSASKRERLQVQEHQKSQLIPTDLFTKRSASETSNHQQRCWLRKRSIKCFPDKATKTPHNRTEGLMAISKLPEEVRSAVRNGTTIVSTAQCVAELVYNSLDADADSIIIHLDMPQYKLQVFDNGSGMTFENLKNCGIRYNTSKCRSLSDIQSNLKFYGYRGEALAGIVASSGTVIILTRPKSDGHTFCKTFSNGKQHHPKRSITSRTCHGTTITVQNFMYNAPVRQQRIKPNIDLEEIRMQVEGLALAHPRVSFTIQDESDNSTILNVTRSQNTLETFSKLYGEEITGNLYPVGPLNSGNHKLYGFISKSSHHNKKLQFIFVNGKLVKRTKVHKLINMIMRKSDVLRGSGPWQELPLPERVRDFLWVSPTKKRDRYCVFLINIDCPLMEYDITLDPEKTLIEFRDWDSLLEGTEKLVKDFLKRHNLAYVTSDPEIGESEEESPTSVLEDVRKLDEEDSVRDKLDRFKHDSAKQEYVLQNEEEGKTSSACVKYKSVPIVPPLEIMATTSEIRIMGKFTENFERLGLSFERCTGNDDKNEEVALRISSIPACLSSKDAKEESSFEMFARTPFLPKGLSPILAKDSAKCVTLGKNNYFKLPPSENLYSVDSGKKVAKDDESFPKKLLSCSENDTNQTGFIASYLSEMENKKYITECKVMSAYESSQNKSIMKIFNLIHPCTFSKSVIAKFKMLGRLDDKFIVAQIDMEESSSSGSLVLFDQHA
ncbi:hypothetical protein J437_LFUL012609, partial [Ladona fulva]